MKNLLKPFFKCFLLLMTIANFSIGQTNNNLFDITPQVGLKYFYWGEYTDQSVIALEEDGILYLAGLSSKTKFSNRFNLYTASEIIAYYGIVDYNGYLQDANGNTEPYQSETAYWGLEFLLNIGYDFYLGKHFILAPEFGFGYEHWNRDVDNGGQYGYDEIYNMFLTDFGLNIITPITSNSKLFLKVLGKFPLSISETIDLASRDQGGPAELNFEPGSNLGINIEVGAVIYRAFLSVYFDEITFSKSNFDQGYHQPESDRVVLGIKLGYNF